MSSQIQALQQLYAAKQSQVLSEQMEIQRLSMSISKLQMELQQIQEVLSNPAFMASQILSADFTTTTAVDATTYQSSIANTPTPQSIAQAPTASPPKGGKYQPQTSREPLPDDLFKALLEASEQVKLEEDEQAKHQIRLRFLRLLQSRYWVEKLKTAPNLVENRFNECAKAQYAFRGKPMP